MHNRRVTDDDLDRLDGSSSSVTLDHRAQTLVFEHQGSTVTDRQKALSPLVIPLGEIASVEYKPGYSTNWFWVVRRGHKPWRDGVWSNPCGVVCGDDPTDFAARVESAVARATPVTAAPDAETPPDTKGSWRGKFAKGLGRAVVDGFFNTR